MTKAYVLIVRPVAGSYGARIMNYDAENKELSRFLSNFDVWGNKNLNPSTDGAVYFEASIEDYDFLCSSTFANAVKRLGSYVIVED